MNLQTITANILSANSEWQLIQFIQNNKTELEVFFVSLSDEKIEEDKFELQDICLDFIGSPFFHSNKHNPEFIGLLTLFAELFEKIGFYGAISIIKANLPINSSIRYRLDAVYQFSKIGHIKEYVEKFNLILSKLQQAQDFSEVDYTGQVVQDTINYYLRGINALKNSTYLGEFKTLFNLQQNKLRYKFLNHPTLNDYLDGYIIEKKPIGLITEKIYSPSYFTQSIFQELIIDHINIAGYLNQYNNDEVRADVLNYGRADFTQSYKNLKPYDRVQLYSYFNMRKHFFTSYAIYETLYTLLKNNIIYKNFTFIDFGCGPLTSGLALASLYYDNESKPISMNYVGIDIAESMLIKAREFAKTNLFSTQSKFHFYTNWELVEQSLIEKITQDNAFVVFNASYLFASSSLDENNLANFVNKVVTKLNNSAYFVFQNPDTADRSTKYQKFKQRITSQTLSSKTQRIYYKNNSTSTFEPSSEVVNFEILSL